MYDRMRFVGSGLFIEEMIFSDTNEETLEGRIILMLLGVSLFIPRVRVESTIKIDPFTLPVYLVEKFITNGENSYS